MAGIGIYGVYYAKCTQEDNVVTGYTGGMKQMGKAIRASFAPDESDENPLYANNGIAENDASGATGGTLTMTLDRLTMEAAADLYGLTQKTVTVEAGGQQVSGAGFDYTGDEISAAVGVAYVKWNQENGNRAIHDVLIYAAVTFKMPDDEAETMEDSIEWQTPEIEGEVFDKSRTGKLPWRKKYRFPSQDAAVAFIASVFGASGGEDGDDENEDGGDEG